jgi:hypothetical protein
MIRRLHRHGRGRCGQLDGGETIQQRGATPARANQSILHVSFGDRSWKPKTLGIRARLRPARFWDPPVFGLGPQASSAQSLAGRYFGASRAD